MCICTVLQGVASLAVIIYAPSIYPSMAELPQYQVRIAAEPGLLNQATLLALCPSYYSIASLVTISGMVCLAYNTGTHRYLVEANILERIEELRQPIDSDLDDDETKTQVLFRYIHVCTSTVHAVPSPIHYHLKILYMYYMHA